MKNFKQSRASLTSLLLARTTSAGTQSITKRNIVSSQNKLPILLNNNNKKNQSSSLATTAVLFNSCSQQQQQYLNYSTTTHFPRASTRLQTATSEDNHHHTIITTIMSSEHHQHEHNGQCCGGNHQTTTQPHLTVSDVSPNSLSGDESEFVLGATRKKVSGIGIKKKTSSSAASSTSSLNSEASCSHHIDYSQLSANHQNPNLSRPEPSDPNLSYTIEGLLQKKPGGINVPIQFEEEFTEEELAAQQSYEKLLNNNKDFVKDKLGSDPDFFNRIKDVQKPDYMLIGCSDSRVPPDQLTKTQPGQIFIHRNVANLVVNTDVNAMSVLQYAVEVLQVKHVIVMGHTRCGGVMAALTNKHLGLIDHWLRNIKDVYRLHKAEVDAIEDKDKKIHRMIELNIIEQTLNLCKTSVVQNAWAKGRTLHVHGWLCDIETGLIKDLEIEEKRWKEIENIYKYDFDL